MLLNVIILLSGLTLCIISVGLFRKWATRHLLDIPNERSSHEAPIPSGGGIGISGITALLAAPLFIASAQWNAVLFLAGAILIAVIGFVDDTTELPARARLLFQGIASALLILGTGAIDQLSVPPLFSISVSVYVAIPISLFWVLSVTNIYNFMDGIDGFAGLQGVVGATAWMLLLLSERQHELAIYAGLLAATSLGFLYWNRPPARIFMGDVGSTFVGFSFGSLPILAFNDLSHPVLLLVGFLFIGPFLFDGTLTIIRRAMSGENILKAHNTHLYQRLAKSGYSHRTIDLIYLPIMLLSALTGFAIWYEWSFCPFMLLVLVITGTGLFAYVTKVDVSDSEKT